MCASCEVASRCVRCRVQGGPGGPAEADADAALEDAKEAALAAGAGGQAPAAAAAVGAATFKSKTRRLLELLSSVSFHQARKGPALPAQ
jgi:hypothetical protein